MRKIGETVLYRGRWLTLVDLEYEGREGSFFHWEVVRRRRTQSVVVVVARLLPSDRVVLVRQFRPAVNAWVIGFPAGIIENGTPGRTALRELREETGYRGKIRRISPPLLSNAALLTDRVFLVHVDIDERAAQNRKPRQSLEPSEEIEVFTVPRRRVEHFMLHRARRGDLIGSGPWYLFGAQCAE